MKLVTVQRTISMGHRLPSYKGICSSMHGHNVRFEASVCVKDEFLDFKFVDSNLESLLARLDHAMVLYEHDPFVPQLQQWPQRLVLLSVEPTTEALAQLIFTELSMVHDVRKVTVHETDKYSASCDERNSGVKRVHLPE